MTPAASRTLVSHQERLVHSVIGLHAAGSLDRVTLEFQSKAIEEPVLEDLVRLIFGRDSAFLRRAPLAGLHPRPPVAGKRTR
jgi:hypothetical protein